MADFTTIQVSELPPNPLSPTSEFPHQVGDILSKANLQQLLDYVRAQSYSQPYEIKYLYPPNSAYITDNFDMTPGATQGIGKTDGLWNGWAIFNGNNGTANLDGITLIGYGATHLTLGELLGSATHTLTESQLPVISPINGTFFKKGTGGGGTTGLTVADNGTLNFNAGEFVKPFGGGQAHNNMQPSMVVLMIYKLP